MSLTLQSAIEPQINATSGRPASGAAQPTVEAESPCAIALTRRQLREQVGPLVTEPEQMIAPNERPDGRPAERPDHGRPASASAPAAALAPVFSAAPPSVVGFSLPPDPFASRATATPFDPATPAGTSAHVTTMAPFTPAPFLATTPTARALTPPVAPPASTTVAVWLLALLPIAHAALLWILFDTLGLDEGVVLRLAALAVPVVISLVFAHADRQELLHRGFDRVPPTALALVPALYLLVRAVRVGRVGIAPLLAWILVQAAAVVFVIVQLPAVIDLTAPTGNTGSSASAPVAVPIDAAERTAQLTPAGMSTALKAQALRQHLTFDSIECPPLAATTDGTEVTCVGTLAAVKVHLVAMVDSTNQTSAVSLMSEAPAIG